MEGSRPGRLLAAVDRVTGSPDREIGFDGKEVGESGALLIGELAADAIRVENGLALRVGHLAEVAEGAADQAPTISREAIPLMHGCDDLLPLRLGQMLQCLVALQYAATLFFRHIVELGKALQITLLGLGGELTEAGFVLEGGVLLIQREVTMTFHPLCQVFLVRAGADGRSWASAVP
jgi:hypothetical protein